MISIIVPVYKVEPYLRQCVNSILDQTYRNIEILLIDDGSPDRCGEICEEFARRDVRIRVFHTENKGLSEARNLGLREAKGEYIGFVDSDDWIKPTMYERLIRNLEETGADICVCGYEREPRSIEKEFSSAATVYRGKESVIALLAGKINNAVWNKLWRSELFRDISFPEGRNYEDLAIFPRIMRAGRTVAVIPDKEYHYRIRSDSITMIHSAKNLIDRADAYLDGYFYYSEDPEHLFSEKPKEILCLAAHGISYVWRWWYQCEKAEKLLYRDRIEEYMSFSRAYFPVFGYRSWPGYLRFSAPFMRSGSALSFAMLYFCNQVYRRISNGRCRNGRRTASSPARQ